jgi:methanogenic corrinoid protein MtbC1
LPRKEYGEDSRSLEKCEASEYFLSELLYAGILASDLFELLKPSMENRQLERTGVTVLDTVRGDIHDLGKKIFKNDC